MLIDTHTHLDSHKFDEDRAEVIERAQAAGVHKLINIGFNRETIPTTMALAEQYSFIYAAVGWHPVDSIDMRPEDLDWIASLCDHPKVVAIGEIGLDYHWDTSPKDVQQRVFREQIQLAKQKRMPIVIHNRDAHEDVVRLLREEDAKDVGGVMHCFSGSWETAKQCLDMNFYISFGGPLTFTNARVPKEVLSQVPLDRILIETDAPYLAPHPHRGKRNESSFVRLVANTISEITGKSVEEVGKITTENAMKCFGI
ncbi:TatD family hydrolase [Paenibacillus sp. BC26]|uniref:TatD family hydrolase n=1 Tax=Paenibacillus sp. BC26 TaxID=1881032 RepID=UPI0008E09752|nr:TatD family hydrolase [Paenibacillus sp. BC26]SFT28620.1 TatD DNase family protein [Paenibacillus sp. BC26]